MTRKLLLISSSNVYGYSYFEYVADSLRAFFERCNVRSVLFIPYASPDYDQYLAKVKTAFSTLNIVDSVRGIHEGEDPITEVKSAQAIFIGGGNTFLLLKTLYEKNLMEPIRQRVLVDSIPYVGSSAGTNVATVSINTTNDMPIVQPPSFKALGLVPFNINPHYLDPTSGSHHMGETRQERITEYLRMPNCHPVLGLREGSSLLVDDNTATLLGDKNAILFKSYKETQDIPPESDLSFLLK